MNRTHRVGDLELGSEPDPGTGWHRQRAGWIAVALLLAAAVAGVFGHGPLSRATASSADGSLQIHYERFIRFESPSSLRLVAGPATTASGELVVHLSRSYFRDVDLDHVTPEPKDTRAGPSDVTYVFAVVKDAPAQIVFRCRALGIGPTHLTVRVRDGPTLELNQFIYP